mmetsp:Transcript_20710/g.65315  ORF Transcript_20710/g.65315 Transcript_20710/m.65315 type:complete len:442 (+) Transcript_20710:76-1401(+)
MGNCLCHILRPARRRDVDLGLLDINAATLEELQALPGIGRQRAEAILDHRRRHGAFRSASGLEAVPGIGPGLVASLRGKVGCGRTAAPGKRPRLPSPAASPPAVRRRVGHEAVFFPDARLPCRHYLAGEACRRKACAFAHEETGLSRLLRLLAGARRRVDLAVYALTQADLADALEAAHKRGVAVRLITDDEQAKNSNSCVARLAAAGIRVRKDDNSKLHMHHKFAVLDGEVLINGSFNWTGAAVKGSNENLVVSTCPRLAQCFSAEFDRLWKAFGAGEPGLADAAIPRPETDISVLFFPDVGGCHVDAVRAEVAAARRSVDVAVFTLTLDKLVDVLIEKHRKGLRVRVITDDRQSLCKGADAKRLKEAGVRVRMDSSSYAMHHKFAVVDGTTLVNGSFNWTAQAARGNQENAVIFHRADALAKSFTAEFERLWAKFGPPA